MEKKSKIIESALPLFRKDLEIFPGPNEPDGSPSYNIYDPARAQFFKITWGESLILRYLRPNMLIQELCREIEMRSTLRVTPEEITAFFNDAYRNNLLAIPRTSQQVHDEAKRREINPIKWLLYNYLYFRVPLFSPDKFLTKTLKYVRPFASKTAFFIYTLLTFFGLYLLTTRWDEYLNTFTYFFNFEGLLFYSLAIISVKVIHELSHAYTAKYYKTRVAAIGIVFIVLWPALYTDVTDSWRLDRRRSRLAISFAGVAAELILAGLCTLGWGLSEPGLMQSIFFVISSASWLTTLAININPAMRFDGYYLLCDLWGVDNLQFRAFAMARWKLRELLLGIKVPPPEEGISEKRLWGMVVYSIYTWFYRVSLYTAIAIFIYFKFTKALGIFLFLLEIIVFLLWPIASEISQLRALRSQFTLNPRLASTLIILSLIFLWFALPLPHAKLFDAVVTPLKDQVIYVPEQGEIQSLNVMRGDQVHAKEIVAVISSKQLDRELGKVIADKKVLEKEIANLEIDPELQSYYREKADELASVQAKVKAFLELKNEMTIRATIPGTVYSWNENLKTGRSVAKGEILGKIGDLQEVRVVAFVPELYVHLISIGQEVEFIMNNTFQTYKGKVTKISPSRAKNLEYPSLASVFQGNVPVQLDAGENLVLQESFYTVDITLHQVEPQLRFGQTGHAKFVFPYYSYLDQWIRYFLNLFWREGGF